ncbi:MAG: hypothetical protein ACRYFS_24765 [Janthinobacterium lividum]
MIKYSNNLLASIAAVTCVLGLSFFSSSCRAAPVMVQSFEKASSLPSVWVVDIPNGNASVQLSAMNPAQGKLCMKLHYHFTTGAGNQ